MGHDKSDVLLGDRTLLAWVVGRLAPVCDPVIVVARKPSDYSGYGAVVVADRWPGGGPLGGLITGLSATETPCAAVVACDLPFVDPALLSGLIGRRAAWDAVVPDLSGLPQPHCAVYARTALEVAEAVFSGGGRSLRELLDTPDLRVLYVGEAELRTWDPTLRSFMNVNTPEDLDLARAMLEDG